MLDSSTVHSTVMVQALAGSVLSLDLVVLDWVSLFFFVVIFFVVRAGAVSFALPVVPILTDTDGAVVVVVVAVVVVVSVVVDAVVTSGASVVVAAVASIVVAGSSLSVISAPLLQPKNAAIIITAISIVDMLDLKALLFKILQFLLSQRDVIRRRRSSSCSR